MKCVISTISLLVITLSFQAQEMTLKTFGQEGTDRGVAIENAIENGFIIAGLTNSFGADGEDIYLVKTDFEGNLDWQKTLGGKGDDNAWVIKKTPDNHYIIGGFSNGFGSGDWDILLIKTDSLGNEVWVRNYGSDKDEFAWDLQITSDNNYVIIGQTNDTKNGETTSIWLKIDNAGNTIWENQLNVPLKNRAFSIVEGENREILFTGLIETKNGDMDGFIAKATSHGNIDWINTYGGARDDLGHTIMKSKDGHYILFGYSKSYGTVNNSPWLIKIDPTGNEVWNYSYGSEIEERIVAGYITDENHCIMLGYRIKEEETGINADILLLEIDDEGQLNWLKTYGGHQNEESGQNILISSKGEIIFTGRTYSQGKGNGDLFLARVLD